MSLGILAATGCVKPPTDDEIRSNDTVVGRMLAEALAFLRCGGVLSWRDWASMDALERDLFGEAARMVAAERASLTGIASQSMSSAVSIGAEADGGETAKALAMEAALQSVVASARGDKPGGPS